nr:MAG TPA: hypothetical protein [Caudoviricetes sp.]
MVHQRPTRSPTSRLGSHPHPRTVAGRLSVPGERARSALRRPSH